MKPTGRSPFRSFVYKGLALGALLRVPAVAHLQSGVVIPSGAGQPSPAVLALDEMAIHVLIDNQDARVRVTQIYGNRTGTPQEGRYVFLIPTTASISDFAVWDGDVRIPGVILEKRRAEELYKDLSLQSIDPGLLKQEREDGADSAFTVELSPIPAYGTKRLELEYTEALPVENLESYYSFPLKPSEYGTQTAGHLEIRLDITSGFPMTDLNLMAKSYPLTFTDNSPLHKSAAYDALNVDLNEDLAFSYGLAVPHTAMQFLA